MRLLLLSNSRNPGGDYLAHALAEIGDFLGAQPRRVAFVPYAATVKFLLYLNVRTRAEGWDVQTRFAALARRAEADAEAREAAE